MRRRLLDALAPVALVACAALAACTSPRASSLPPADLGPADSTTSASPSTTTSSTSTSVPPTTARPTTAPPTTVPPPVLLTFAFSGDTLLHTPLWERARRAAEAAGQPGYDFRGMLAPLQPLVSSADMAICHLETPLVPEGEDLSTFPLYGVPAEIAPALAATGYDRCSTASNHTYDRGNAGIDRTVTELEKAGIHQSGMARTPADLDDRFFDLKGVRIAHLAYTFSFNGLRLPEGEEWRSAVIDPVRIIADATAAREAGAQVVIVSLHWGVEGYSDPTPWQRRVAEQLTASGQIDLIVGHHAHVLQPIERVNGVWVVYGMGNILSGLNEGGGWPSSVHDGVVVTVSITVIPSGAGTGTPAAVEVATPVAHPTYVDRWTGGGFVVQPVIETLLDPSIGPGLRHTLTASLARTQEVLGDFLPK